MEWNCCSAISAFATDCMALVRAYTFATGNAFERRMTKILVLMPLLLKYEVLYAERWKVPIAMTLTKVGSLHCCCCKSDTIRDASGCRWSVS